MEREVAGAVTLAGQHQRQDKRGEQRTDRVVDDRLPFEERRRPPLEPVVADQRKDNRRTGDCGDRAKEQGGTPRHAADERGSERGQHEADRQRDGRQAQHALRCRPQLTEVEREAAFEHHDRHCETNDRPQCRAELDGRLQDLQSWPNGEADGEKQHDGRQLQPPCYPLRRHSRAGDAEHGDGHSVRHA